jgi:hypothetical protein
MLPACRLCVFDESERLFCLLLMNEPALQ